MSNEKTQLPPELVEKYDQAIRGYEESDDVFRFLRHKNHCAQIAAEYVEELVKNKDQELSVERYKTRIMNEAYEKAKQQRDELLEALKTVQICSNYKEVKAKHGNCDNWVNIIDELINKINGKE